MKSGSDFAGVRAGGDLIPRAIVLVTDGDEGASMYDAEGRFRLAETGA